MSAETIIGLWKDARGGLIEEVEKIPEDQFSFRATPDTRTVSEILQHVISTQKIIVGEACRPDTNLRRQSFAAHAEEYAPGVGDVTDKNGLIELLRTSMDECAAKIGSSRCDRCTPMAHRAAATVSENTRKFPSPAVETTRPPSAASSRSIRPRCGVSTRSMNA